MLKETDYLDDQSFQSGGGAGWEEIYRANRIFAKEHPKAPKRRISREEADDIIIRSSAFVIRADR